MAIGISVCLSHKSNLNNILRMDRLASLLLSLFAVLAALTQTQAHSRRSFGLAHHVTSTFGRSPSSHLLSTRPSGLEFLSSDPNNDNIRKVQPVGLYKNLIRGAVLRVASDLTGGTPLESIKCRVTTTMDGPIDATKNIIKQGGFWSLWAGTPSRTVEGRLW